MKNRSRKKQCEAIAREVKSGKTPLRQAMRDACFVGAAEERSHCLKIIESSLLDSLSRKLLVEAIIKKSVLEVIGYA